MTSTLPQQHNVLADSAYGTYMVSIWPPQPYLLSVVSRAYLKVIKSGTSHCGCVETSHVYQTGGPTIPSSEVAQRFSHSLRQAGTNMGWGKSINTLDSIHNRLHCCRTQAAEQPTAHTHVYTHSYAHTLTHTHKWMFSLARPFTLPGLCEIRN